MKLLLVSDEEEPYLWDHYQPGRLKGYDAILSAGDLKPEYLTFLVTMANRPLLYVHGNHDTNYEQRPPEGCDCIDDKIICLNGWRILGLGGCPVYSGGEYQYTEQQMAHRIWKLGLKIRRVGGIDIVLTHAPAKNCGDGEDYAHRGFGAFVPLLEKYKPQYLIHGHVHLRYGRDVKRISSFGETTIVNAVGRYELELPDREFDLSKNLKIY